MGPNAGIDVSSVPPQGGRTATRCPLRVQYAHHPPVGVEPGEPAEVDRLRAEAAAAFRSEVLADVVTGVRAGGGAAVIDGGLADHRKVAATLRAMGAGVAVVTGGRLPDDLVGRRAGSVDLLVRAERRHEGTWAYHPVQIRNHRTLDEPKRRSPESDVAAAVVSPLTEPWFARAASEDERMARSHHGDRMVLAHLHRMLEQTPHASVEPVGAAIGTERVVVWHDLNTPMVQHRWDRAESTSETALARYDFEFSFRLAVLATAGVGRPMVGPVAVGECGSCPWRDHCRPRIEAADSTSLLPGFGYRQWFNLDRAGIATRAQVAALDLPTATVRDALVGIGDLPALVAAARSADAGAPAREVVDSTGSEPPGSDLAATEVSEQDDPASDRADRVVDALARCGIDTAGDLALLDATVVALAGQPIRRLADAIQGARAQASGRPQVRDGIERLEVPSADIEIDIDMESALDGTTYLWGAWTAGGYHSFGSWDPSGAEVEATVFAGFWEWLQSRRREATAAGRSVAVYCWFQGAEAGALRRGAAAAAQVLALASAAAEVEELLAGHQFVDLYEVFTSQLVTGGSAGLKVVATSAGFAWRDSDPNGADSMAWHAHAVDGTDRVGRDAARERLLAYNEDDVRATAAVRHWMRGTSAGRPSTSVARR